jgi:MOSC domain-containing protein YiiM
VGGEQRGTVVAVNVVAELRPDGDTGRLTAIDKRPVAGRVYVGELGVAGDRQMDTKHHGGPDQAVYAYAIEDLDDWAHRLGPPLRPGMFGENLTLRGLDVSGALIGERWRIGAHDESDAVEVEVTQLRIPCNTFKRWMGEPQWVRRFADQGRFGAYLRVVRTGTIAAGDTVTVVRRPAHRVPITATFRGLAPADAASLRTAVDAGDLVLARGVRDALERAERRESDDAVDVA